MLDISSLSNAICDDMQLLHMSRILSDVIMRHLLLVNAYMHGFHVECGL